MKLVIPHDYGNREAAEIIDEYIHDETHRKILKRRFCDKVKYEPLAEEFHISVSQLRRILDRGLREILKHF